ncbi:WXG100 family type VII secretion target [Nocardia lasii]|uniref:WXG100 family type VII secretion target n=1 Tax=Nocardia lasii TaxID=1616107 RepID=A0ABW1K0K6_9NOCA
MGFDDPSTTNNLVTTGTDHRSQYQPAESIYLGPFNIGPRPANLEITTATPMGMGTGLTTAEAVWEISEGLEKGDVGLVILGAAAAGLDISSAMTDPIAYIGGQIISWMLEHVEPARKALESVTGNPAMVKEYAASWVNIQQHMIAVRDDLQAAVDTGTTSWEGAASTAYRTKAAELIAQADAAAGAAYGTSVATMKMAEIVTGVRTAVRDLLSAIAGAMISWTVELMVSVGTATPLVIAQATTKIASVVATVAKLMDGLKKAVLDLGAWAVVLKDLVDGVYRAETTGATAH